MKTESWQCDIDGCDNPVPENTRGTKLQVIFTTEQTEGRPTTPYFSDEKIDICHHCLKKVVESGKYMRGSGAQGHNTFTLQE